MVTKEEPKLLHPEYDNFEKDISFDLDGKIVSENERVIYTVKICDLNRINLLNSRESILNDFINKLNTHFKSFETNYDGENFEICLEYFKVTIEEFCKESDIKYAYSLIREKSISDFEGFLDDINLNFEDKDFVKEVVLSAFLTFSN